MATFLVVHGAWTGGWFWKKIRPLLEQHGHTVFTPTLTGVGERLHLCRADVDLDTHITDILNVIRYEDLSDLILVGHSYGGMVATGVADRVPDRIRRVVYVDAFVPRHGQSLLGLKPENEQAQMLESVRVHGNGWLIPPNPMPADSSEEDIAWAVPRRTGQPLETFRQPIELTGRIDSLHRTYIYCTRAAPSDTFKQFADRARVEAGWMHLEIDASHNPQVTAPAELARMLNALAEGEQS